MRGALGGEAGLEAVEGVGALTAEAGGVVGLVEGRRDALAQAGVPALQSAAR